MTYRTQRRVEFRDTDAAGIVHFAAFFPMMETAEHELLRSLGIPILSHSDSGDPPLTWPRVAAGCNYLAAARFEDVLEIAVRIAKVGSSSVQYEFHFTRDGEPIADGRLTSVCCQLSPDGGLSKFPVPDSIRQRLARYQ